MTKTAYKKLYISILSIVVLGLTGINAQTEQDKIDSLIIAKRQFNMEHANSSVYKIQLYYGSENAAFDTKEAFLEDFPDLNCEVVPELPDWKTQVSFFRTRIEADRVLLKIKKKFPYAIVFKDKH